MEAALHREVWQRAANRCEYCQLPQSASSLTFHVEHIIARQHGGATVADNLALACDRCNLFKGPNLAAIDPATNHIVRLFDPRRDSWAEHFRLQDATILGATPEGRATVRLLRMNAPARLMRRAELLDRGEY